MTNLVIVAIPKEDDYVNKISSEQVPHMTLLFLGDMNEVTNLSRILDFTKHASDQMLTSFDLEVDHRGVLGPNLADVLFFSKSKWSGYDIINRFRYDLTQNNDIKSLYEVNEQFDNWVPHLTLGYPETPAKPDDRDYPGIRYVSFDRIAVWFKDYDGIEFPLKSYDFDMAMGNILMHGTSLYDPVKAHEYYVRTRQLKGHHRGAQRSIKVRAHTRQIKPMYTVKTQSGTHKLSQQQLVEQQAYAAQRVEKIKSKLDELTSKLKKMLATAQQSQSVTPKKPTAATKAKAVRRALQYNRAHKTQIAAKAKSKRQTQPKTTSTTSKNNVATVERKITEVKNRLQVAVATQRALLTATKNG